MLSLFINDREILVDVHLTIWGLYETLYFKFKNVHFILFHNEERLGTHDHRTLTGSGFYNGTILVMQYVRYAFYELNSFKYIGTKTYWEPIKTLKQGDKLEVYWVSPNIYELCRRYPDLIYIDRPNGGIREKVLSLLLDRDIFKSIIAVYADYSVEQPYTPNFHVSTSFPSFGTVELRSEPEPEPEPEPEVDDEYGWRLCEAHLEEDDNIE